MGRLARRLGPLVLIPMLLAQSGWSVRVFAEGHRCQSTAQGCDAASPAAPACCCVDRPAETPTATLRAIDSFDRVRSIALMPWTPLFGGLPDTLPHVALLRPDLTARARAPHGSALVLRI